MVPLPVELTPLQIAIPAGGKQLGVKVRNSCEHRGPVLKDLGAAAESPAGVDRLGALVVVREEGSHEFGVVGILRIGEALEDAPHGIQPSPRLLQRARSPAERIAADERASGTSNHRHD